MKKLLLIGLILTIVGSVKGISQEEYHVRLAYNAIFQEHAKKNASLEGMLISLGLILTDCKFDGELTKKTTENIKKTIFQNKVVTGVALTTLIASIYAIYEISKKVKDSTKKMVGYVLAGATTIISTGFMVQGLYNINKLNELIEKFLN